MDSASIALIVTALLGVPAAVLTAYSLVRKAGQPFDRARSLLQRVRDIAQAKDFWTAFPLSLRREVNDFLDDKNKTQEPEDDESITSS